MSLNKFSIIALLLCLAFIVIINAQVKQQKASQTLNEKVQHLLNINLKKTVLKFNDKTFRKYVQESPRNYSVIVMLTAMAPARQCAICRYAHDEFTLAANSYRSAPIYSNKLFFAMVDFDEASGIFRKLQLINAPVFMHFPAKGKQKGPDTLDIHRVGFSAEAISKFVHERTDIQIRIFRPPNYFGIVTVITLGAVFAGFLYFKPNSLGFLKNKQMWGFLSILFCFAMISGQMWNHIHSPALFAKSRSGVIRYIDKSSQTQLGMETYIVIFLNAMIVLGMIFLAESGRQPNMFKGRIMAFIGLGLVATFFSLLLSIFRMKAGEYIF